MSKLLRWSVCGCAAALMLGVNTSFATVSFTSAPYARQNATVSYAGGPADYMSRADIYGTGTSANDLAGVNSFQGAISSTGLGNAVAGIGYLVTPQTGSTYGALNNHGFAVHTMTAPLAGSTTSDLTVTLTIESGFLSNGDGVTPVAPNDAAAADTWVRQSLLMSDTFTYSNPNGTASLVTFDLNSYGLTFAADQSYVVGFQWAVGTAGGTRNNELLIDRGPSVDPGGQYMGLSNPTTAWGTSANKLFSAQAPRTAAIAFNVVPEPGTFVLLGLAAPALAWAARRRKS